MEYPPTLIETPENAIVQAVIDSVDSPHSKRAYRRSIEDFIIWYIERGRPTLSKAVVQRYATELKEKGMGVSSINLRLSGIRKMAQEAADNGLIDIVHAIGIQNVKGVRKEGKNIGNWLTKKQAQDLLNKPDITSLKGLRDRAILAVFIGCGLRRQESSNLKIDQLQQREGRWVIVDMVGKRNKIRSVPMPNWCKAAIDEWLLNANIIAGYIFCAINKGGKINGISMTPQALRNVVVEYSPKGISPHDLRRTFAKLARKGGAELTQIQLSLGHSNVKTTQDYIGEDQDLVDAPCDVLGIKL